MIRKLLKSCKYQIIFEKTYIYTYLRSKGKSTALKSAKISKSEFVCRYLIDGYLQSQNNLD